MLLFRNKYSFLNSFLICAERPGTKKRCARLLFFCVFFFLHRALQGFVLDGKAHFHMVVSDVEAAYTGHLEPGTTVLYLGEVSLVELKGVSLCRKKDENNIGKITDKED